MSQPLMFRLAGTVIVSVWWQVLLMGLWTTAIVCVDYWVEGMKINFPMTLITVLGAVTSLLVAFRTNSAYDRYWEGRKVWSTMTVAIRNLTRIIWVMVKDEPGTTDEDEKIPIINLLIGYAYSVKNYLREEYDYDKEDIRELIKYLPKFSTPSSNLPLDDEESEGETANLTNKTAISKILEVDAKTHQRIKNKNKKKKALKPKEYKCSAYAIVVRQKHIAGTFWSFICFLQTPTNIPIELSYYLAAYINSIRERNLIDSSALGQMNSGMGYFWITMLLCGNVVGLGTLIDCLTSFERILRTPIPLAYSVHLHHTVWIYLIALPIQLISQLQWYTIPVVIIASFCLTGMLAIGWEIENPFGYDANDLPLDDFCKVIHKECHMIIGHKIDNPTKYFPKGMIAQQNSHVSKKGPEHVGENEDLELAGIVVVETEQ